jgi:hypothetical protein
MPFPQLKAQRTPNQIKVDRPAAPISRVATDVRNSENRGATARRDRSAGRDG